MKRSTIEKKLNEAMQRRAAAAGDEHYFQRQVDYHDAEASRIRKDVYKQRAKKDRADRAISKLSNDLAKIGGIAS